MRRTGFLLLTLIAWVPVVALQSQAQSVLTHQVRDVVESGAAQPIGRLSQARS
jgi:hypothetical protein